MNHRIFIIVGITVILALSGCEEYIFGPQPKIIDEESFDSKLNIFGILRPDSLREHPASFIRVDKAVAMDSLNNDTLPITDAVVKIYEINSSKTDSFQFNYTDYDSAYGMQDYRPDDFIPEPGMSYKLICRHTKYETVIGYTTVPEMPELVNPIQIVNNELKFTVRRDQNVGLYEFNLMKGDLFHYHRQLSPDSGHVKVSITLPEGFSKPFDVTIYAYDNNLAEYNTYSLYYKPNTYQPPYSTLNNGYGCFGSLNILKRQVMAN